MIDIAIFDEHHLALQGITGLLSEVSDFSVVFEIGRASCRERV